MKIIINYCAYSILYILKSVLLNVIPFLYDKLCIKYIWEEFHPSAGNNKKRSPGTLLIRILVIYIILFGLVSIRYEQAIGRVENRVRNIYYQSKGENWRAFFSKIPDVQRIKVPFRPVLYNPVSVFYSIWSSNDAMDIEVVRELQDLVRSRKTKLTGMVLNNLILSEITVVDGELRMHPPGYFPLGMRDFTGSNFTSSWLQEAIFSNTDFQFSIFNGATLHKAQLSNCNLSYAKFREADLTMADLKKSNLSGADLRNASLMGTDLTNTILLGTNLYDSYDLKTAKLKGAWYNSREIKIKDDLISEESLNSLCSKGKVSNTLCPYLVANFPYAREGSATIFPDGFNPKEYDMLDASEIIDLVKRYVIYAKQ